MCVLACMLTCVRACVSDAMMMKHVFVDGFSGSILRRIRNWTVACVALVRSGGVSVTHVFE